MIIVLYQLMYKDVNAMFVCALLSILYKNTSLVVVTHNLRLNKREMTSIKTVVISIGERNRKGTENIVLMRCLHVGRHDGKFIVFEC